MRAEFTLDADTYSWSAGTLFMAYKTPGARRERRKTHTSTGSLILENLQNCPSKAKDVIPP